jgi:dTDP-4-dehydrorhamnose 3,5-epimerase
MTETIDGVKILPLKKYEDPRGWLAESFRQDELDFAPVMSYVSWTRQGTTRGPHEHRYQTDYFVFAWGAFRLTLWDNRPWSPTHGKKMEIEAGGDQPAGTLIPPGVVHAYTCLSKEGGCVVNLPDRLYAGIGKKEPVDEIRHEADPKSPFKVK